MTSELRERVLRGVPGDFSIRPRGKVWGVVIETGFASGAASLVALADGNASLYFSSGGGVIGGAEHASVRSAAVNLCDVAGRVLDATNPTTTYPLPSHGSVRVYLLTTGGVRGAEAEERGLAEGKHPLSALFMAGQEVITQLRRVSASAAQSTM